MKALQKAREAWGDAAPDWIVALADYCDATSQRRAGELLGVSAATVNLVLANRYGADTSAVAERVRKGIAVRQHHAALGGWGASPPDWIAALAKACDERPQTEVARTIEYSPAVVSQVLRNTYKGNLRRVEMHVRGLLMAQTTRCPALDVPPFGHEPIGLEVCVWNQEAQFDKRRALPGFCRPFQRACPTCPNWLKTKSGGK